MSSRPFRANLLLFLLIFFTCRSGKIFMALHLPVSEWMSVTGLHLEKPFQSVSGIPVPSEAQTGTWLCEFFFMSFTHLAIRGPTSLGDQYLFSKRWVKMGCQRPFNRFSEEETGHDFRGLSNHCKAGTIQRKWNRGWVATLSGLGLYSGPNSDAILETPNWSHKSLLTKDSGPIFLLAPTQPVRIKREDLNNLN